MSKGLACVPSPLPGSPLNGSTFSTALMSSRERIMISHWLLNRLIIPVMSTFPVGTLALAKSAKLLLYTITFLPSCSFKVQLTLPAPPFGSANVSVALELLLLLKLTLRIMPSFPPSVSRFHVVGFVPVANNVGSTICPVDNIL